MADACSTCTCWVPRLGWLDMPADRTALIRGLYRFAAWVVDHPDVPLPIVEARVPLPCNGFDDECAAVDGVAAALEIVAEFRGDGRYTAEGFFGPVAVSCTAISDEYLAAWRASNLSTAPATAKGDGPTACPSSGGAR